MRLPTHRYGVWLYDREVGVLEQRGDHVRFAFHPEYWNNPQRAILGLRFEEHPRQGVSSALRLPPWFSNLLPESRLLRDWIARDRGVSPQREMELLAQIGHDLPGAVRVFDAAGEPPPWLDTTRMKQVQAPPSADPQASALRKFSLAGVGLKFSLLQDGDRLTLPASGDGGDWIVKLPDPKYPHVPLNEYAMMTLAARAGIEVPRIQLRNRDELPPLPDAAWPTSEDQAYSIRRFDRGSSRELIHIEDFAQLKGIYPDRDAKYEGSFETVARLCYRGWDVESLREFARRLCFTILIGNGDAHLKNWSLIYRNPRKPTLSPVYDLVSTVVYDVAGPGREETLALKFGKSDRFESPSRADFDQLANRVGAPGANLVSVVDETVERTVAAWPEIRDTVLGDQPAIAARIEKHLHRHAATITRA